MAQEDAAEATGTTFRLFDARLDAGRLDRMLWVTLAAVALLAALTLLRIYAWSWVDEPISAAFNAYARRWELVDHAIRRAMELQSIKGLAALALAYAAFAEAKSISERGALVAACLGACLSTLLSRAMQMVLPRFPRPLVDPRMNFTAPYRMEDDSIGQWSSFPSDTAALLFGLAAAILVVNRRWGLLTLAIAVFASLTRIYCGRHYTTDILAGAALGTTLAVGSAWIVLKWRLAPRAARVVMRQPAIFAALAFFFSAQAATQFQEPRAIASSLAGLFGAR